MAEIPENIKSFIDTVAERYGYYFGKRVLLSQMFKETKEERNKVRSIRKQISKLQEEYIKSGKNVRRELKALYEQLNDARKVLSEKSKPFYNQIKPLNQALSFMDKVVIPAKLKELGREVKPLTTVSPSLSKRLIKK